MTTEPKSVKKPINKRIFKIEYVLVIILVILLLFLFISSFKGFSFFNSETETVNSNFENTMEEKLEKILSTIDGAGSVSVMISVDGTTEKQYLKNSQTKKENGVEIIEETTVLVSGKPFLTKENYPEVLGVVVVCQGGENVKVKMAITEVITTVLPVTSENIRILKKK